MANKDNKTIHNKSFSSSSYVSWLFLKLVSIYYVLFFFRLDLCVG